MSKKEKLLRRLLSTPKDFRWGELTTLLRHYGYTRLEGDGSRVKFFLASPRNLIIIHKPHPGEILKAYQVKDVIKNLSIIGVIHGND